jgi:hypothetical protein
MAVKKGGTFARAVANAGQASATSKTGIVQSIGSGTVDVLMNDSSGLRQKVKTSGGTAVVGAEVTIVEVDGKAVAQVSAGEARSARGAGLVIINNNLGGSGNGFPLAHAATHQAGGSDALTPAMIGAATSADIAAAIAAHLADDDAHPEYLLASGARALTGTLTTQAFVPDAPDTRDVGTALMRYRRGYFAEIDNVIFAQDTISVHQNMLIVPKGSGTLPELVYSTATSIDFGATMSANDIVILNGIGAVEYVQVGTLVSGTKYNVTRNLDGTGANEWPAGTIWVDYGYDGDGRIVIDDTDGKAKLSILLQGTTYNSITERLRLGHMDGAFGITTDVWGFGVGDYADGNYMRYEESGGFTIHAGGGIVALDDDGITIEAANTFDGVSAYKFTKSGAVVSGLWAYSPSAVNEMEINVNAISGKPSVLPIISAAPSGQTAAVSLAAKTGTGIYPALTISTGVGGTDPSFAFTNGNIKIVSIKESTAIGARVYNNANLSIANTTDTALTFNSERFDTDSIHSTSSNTSRLTCQTPGVYLIHADVSFAINASGLRFVYLRLNGTTIIAESSMMPISTGARSHMVVTTLYELDAGDYVEVLVYQTSGGSLTVDYLAAHSPEFGMVRIA